MAAAVGKTGRAHWFASREKNRVGKKDIRNKVKIASLTITLK